MATRMAEPLNFSVNKEKKQNNKSALCVVGLGRKASLDPPYKTDKMDAIMGHGHRNESPYGHITLEDIR
jgi:hypothetical protein